MVVSELFKYADVKGIKLGYHPFSSPMLYVYVYFVDGLLIDTGQSKVRNRILAETKDLPIEHIFVTHHHEDHTGNIDALREAHDCSVYASAACCEIMKSPPPISYAQKLTWGERPAVVDLIPVTEVLNTPTYSFQIIPISRHASDMVALYEPNRKWLFSADLYINSYIDYFLESESIAQQMASIKRILDLDFNELFCCHKPQMVNGKAQLKKKLNFLETFFEKVTRHHEKGYTASEVFKIMNLKENWFVRLLSGGNLSKLNMVKSVIRDLHSGESV